MHLKRAAELEPGCATSSCLTHVQSDKTLKRAPALSAQPPPTSSICRHASLRDALSAALALVESEPKGAACWGTRRKFIFPGSIHRRSVWPVAQRADAALMPPHVCTDVAGCKERGNSLFKLGKFDDAISCACQSAAMPPEPERIFGMRIIV